MKHVFADRAYDRRKLLDKAVFLDFVVEVVRRSDTDPGFKVISRPPPSMPAILFPRHGG